MSLYKVPFDFTHEEKVFRWLSIIKTNVICNCKCNIIRNIIFSYFKNRIAAESLLQNADYQ